MPSSRNKLQILSAKDEFFSRIFSRVSLILAILAFEGLFDFVIVFLILPVFQYSSRLIYPWINCLCSSEKVGSFSTFSNILVSLFMRLLISVNFEVLFKSSPCMLCKALLIPKNCQGQDQYFVMPPMS